MSRRRGSLLLVALWLVAVLAMLSIAVAHREALEIRLVRSQIEAAQARALARGGVRYAMALLRADAGRDQFDGLGDIWSVDQTPPPSSTPRPPDSTPPPSTEVGALTVVIPAGDGMSREASITLRMVDEERKLPINRIGEKPVADMFQSLFGAEATKLIANYIAPSTAPPGGGDEPLPGLHYVPKHGPIAVLEELFDIPGLAEALPTSPPDALRASASPYLGSGDKSHININTADEKILAAALSTVVLDPSVSPASLARRIVEFRWDLTDPPTEQKNAFVSLNENDRRAIGNDNGLLSDLVNLIGPSLTGLFTTQSSIFSVTSQARFAGSLLGAQVTAVIDRTNIGGKDSPIRAWREGL